MPSAMYFAAPRPKLMVCVASTGRARRQATRGVAWRVPARLAAIDLLGAASVVASARLSALETFSLTRLLPACLACPIAHLVVNVFAAHRPRSRATGAIARQVAARLAAIHLLGPASVVARARSSALETLSLARLFPARPACPSAILVVKVVAECWPRCRATRAIARRVAARLAAINLLGSAAMLRRARRRALEAPRGSAIVADVICS